MIGLVVLAIEHIHLWPDAHAHTFTPVCWSMSVCVCEVEGMCNLIILHASVHVSA